MKNIVRKTLKIVGWIIASVILLIVLVLILIQIPAVQNFAKDKAVAFLEKKIKTRVEVDKLSISFPKQIVLKGIYFEDQNKDTLLAGKELRVDIALFGLLRNEVNVSYLGLEGIRANIYRVAPDTVFNFDYIVKAFSSEQEKPPGTDTTSTLKFHLDKISLKDILATFKDDETGNDVYFYLGDFETNIKKFDLDNLSFHVPRIDIDNIVARIHQYKPIIPNPDSSIAASTVPSSPSESSPQIALDDLNLKNIDFNYKNDISALLADLKLGELSTHPEKIDLATMFIRLNDLNLNNTKIKVLLGKTQQAEAVKEVVSNKTEAEASNPWKIQINKVGFNNNELIYDDENKPEAKEGMDFSHLHVTGFILNADSLSFTPSEFRGNVKQLALNEKSGFQLEKFNTSFVYNDSGAALNDLLLQTDVTVLRNKILVTWPSIEAISKNPGKMFVDANLLNSYIGMKDIFTFLPTFKKNAAGYRNSNLKINTRIKGYVSNLDIPLLELQGLRNTSVSIKGTIKGLPDAKHTVYNLKINRLQSSKNDVMALLPPNTLPSSFRLPDVFSVTGFFNGSMEDFSTDLALRTNKGNVDVVGKMQPNERYNASVSTHNLQLGYLLKQEENLGAVTLQANVSGSGFDPKKANIDYDVNVSSAVAKGYNYTNLSLTGNAINGLVTADAKMTDPNLTFALNTVADINQKYPAIKLNLNLDTADLKALHLVSDSSFLALSGKIDADIPVSNPDSLIGKIFVRDLNVNNGKNVFTEDSISVISDATAEAKNLHLFADEIQADLVGQYKLTEIAQALQSTINRYYNLPGFKDTAFAAQNWDLNARIIPTGMLLEFMPDLRGSDSITVHSSFNSTANDLRLEVKNNKLVMSPNEIDSLSLIAQTEADRLNFGLSVNNVTTPSIKIYNTSIDGFVADNKMNFDLGMNDQKNKTQFALGGILSQIKNGIEFSLKPDLMLDYEKWNVKQDNFIQYDSTGILVHNFGIDQDGQSLLINSQSDSTNSPILVDFNNFKIGTITRIANQDSLLLDGIINGKATVEDIMKDPVFTSDLSITNIVYKTDTVGNLAVKVDNKTADQFNADISLTGNNNDVRITGMYNTAVSEMDMNVALNQLNLETIKPFAAGQIDDITGFLKGNASVTGSLEQPNIYGAIHFENATVVPTVSGERFQLPNDEIELDPRGMHFHDFTIQDSAKNKLVVDGDVLTSDFRNIYFNLNVTGENFELVNTPKKTDQLFYGKLNIDTDIKLRGSIEAPKADAFLRINDETDFSVVLPSNNPELIDREGVVVFVDKDNPKDSASLNYLIDTLVAQMPMTGIEVTGNIEIDSAAQFTLVIDERNGDALSLKGRADLSGGIDQSGKISLTGNYELTGGSYELSLSFMKRKFEIQRGSTITWTGDPTSAQIDVTAIYVAKAASIDLVEQQLSGRPPVEVNQFKEKLPFRVLLNMTGELLKPNISFDITLPQDELSQWPIVDTRLQQVRTDESELNKQVFALLLLNRFVGENPLQSQAEGGGIEGAVRESASQTLTDQLNQLAGSLISGVDLNFGITSGQDYSTGQAENRTDLNVGVSKRLLNDRITVNVGSNFELEGPQNSNRNASNIAGDVSIDYALSKDGRYRLRAYRKNQYEGVIEGQIIETGLTFMLSYDYDTFKELFEGRKEKKLIRQKIRESNKDAKETREEQTSHDSNR